MNKNIANWIKSSSYDLKTAEHMFKTGRYIKELIKWLKRDKRLKI